jgi:glycopeptide antibiotics resistance protein
MLAEKPRLARAVRSRAVRVSCMSRRRFYGLLLTLYAAILVLVTLVPRPGASVQAGLDVVPFRQTWRLIEEARDAEDAVTPIVGNIALFVPLGWLLPMTWSNVRALRRIVIVAAACSGVIELSQMLFISGRSPTIDDVILNALGAAIGGVMFFAPRVAG